MKNRDKRTPDGRLRINQRVETSPKWKERWYRGVVVGISRITSDYIRVLRDGHKNSETWAASFWQILPRPKEPNNG